MTTFSTELIFCREVFEFGLKSHLNLFLRTKYQKIIIGLDNRSPRWAGGKSLSESVFTDANKRHSARMSSLSVSKFQLIPISN